MAWFQSAPLTEARGDAPSSRQGRLRFPVSIRSPHRSKGRLMCLLLVKVFVVVSIRSPHRSKGRQFDRLGATIVHLVSIRSPHRSKGRPQSVVRMDRPCTFQSAPLTEARGDRGRSAIAGSSKVFQSAPLTEARGDLTRQQQTSQAIYVSIRSPHRSKGRPFPSPRLLPPDRVSIRSPHRSKGRHPPPAFGVRRPSFQSAPLTEARGDPMFVTFRAGLVEFQSAPLTEARGDLRAGTGLARHYAVSIRSLHRSKGRPDATRWPLSSALFQSAPLTEARGDVISSLLVVSSLGFNPLPSPKQGETPLTCSSTGFANVSIRSPHRSKGRPATPA